MRGKQAPKRIIKPDAKYNSELVSKLINYVMQDGKKNVATTNVYKAIEEVANITKTKGIEALEKAMENIKPKLEVRSKRIGGSNFQVPMPVNKDRQVTLAFRWILESARNGRGKSEFWQVLAREITSAYHNDGNAVKKKEEMHRMADANKAFAQFA